MMKATVTEINTGQTISTKANTSVFNPVNAGPIATFRAASAGAIEKPNKANTEAKKGMHFLNNFINKNPQLWNFNKRTFTNLTNARKTKLDAIPAPKLANQPAD